MRAVTTRTLGRADHIPSLESGQLTDMMPTHRTLRAPAHRFPMTPLPLR
jgi:hypothetical protein